MSIEPSKVHAMSFLRESGFHFAEIKVVPGEKRADLRATWSDEEYVIEAKMRHEHQSWRDLLEAAGRHGAATTSRPVDPWNAISSMIRDAHEQLLATPAGRDAFRILWITALHDDDTFVLDCVEKRLFGLELLSVVKSMSLEQRPTAKLCYFHGPSDFRRFRTLDAAVLATRTGAWLCVNTFSAKRTHLRSGQLYQQFERHQAVRDPEILERADRVFVMGDDYCPDPTGRQGWAYIRKKYGVLTSKMFESNFRAIVSSRSLMD